MKLDSKLEVDKKADSKMEPVRRQFLFIRVEVVDRAATEFTMTARPQEVEGRAASMSLAFMPG